jgi:integrase
MEGHVRKRGAKWYYSFEAATVDGKRKRIERVGGNTKKDAEAALRTALQQYNNAGLHFEPTEISYSDYLDYWIDNYVKVECRENTQRIYSDIIRIHLKPYLGMYKVKAIVPMVIQQHLNKLYAQGLSKNYLSNIYGVLSGSFSYAVEPGHMIKENPMTYVKTPKCLSKKSDTDHKIISKQEFNNIIERFPIGSQYYILLMICYYTGTRIAECTGISWDRVDLEKGTLTIDRILVKHSDKKWYLGDPKTATSNRTIPIGETLIKALREHRKLQLENRMKYGNYYMQYYVSDTNNIYGLDNKVEYKTTDKKIEFICCQENGTLINPDLARYCSRVINFELGIQFNFHSLRHTHATILIESGANMKDVQKRLGHAQLSTTMDTYVTATEKMSTQTVNIFEKAINHDLPTE